MGLQRVGHDRVTLREPVEWDCAFGLGSPGSTGYSDTLLQGFTCKFIREAIPGSWWGDRDGRKAIKHDFSSSLPLWASGA